MANVNPALAPAPGLFHSSPEPQSYVWWYADGMSRDGNSAFTLIAFIGSVFSPYYAWSGRKDPHNHCAINLALYSRHRGRWVMTERGRSDLSVGPDHLQIGPSALQWDGTTLKADIAEYGMPIPHRVRGRIFIRPRTINTETFNIDSGKLHNWRPIAPFADVELELSEPGLRWSGEGYLDTNFGPAPLEETFRGWDWSRVHTHDGSTFVLYDTAEMSGAEQHLALRFRPDGSAECISAPPRLTLPPTDIFRIRRTTRAADTESVHLGRTLEDTPFYSRSIIECHLMGMRAAGIHESFDGGRLSSPIVKLMLPFRMPRRPIRD